jgi:hypothetical protein
VAALTIFERITGHDVRTLPPEIVLANGEKLNVPEVTVRMIQDAVHEVNSRYP